IRDILFKIEENPTGFAGGDIAIDGYSEEEIGYHCYLICDAGLAAGVSDTNLDSTSPRVLISHLNWQGHEFIDAARDDTVWNKAKDTVKKSVKTASIEVMKQVLNWVVRSQLGIP